MRLISVFIAISLCFCSLSNAEYSQAYLDALEKNMAKKVLVDELS